MKDSNNNKKKKHSRIPDGLLKVAANYSKVIKFLFYPNYLIKILCADGRLLMKVIIIFLKMYSCQSMVLIFWLNMSFFKPPGEDWLEAKIIGT